MFILLFLMLGVVILVMQTTILPLLPAWLGKPDVLFLLIIYVACRADILRGAVVILILGLLMDVFSGIFLGLYPVIYLLVFAFIKAISRQIAINEFAYQVPLAVISYLAVSAGMFVFSFLLAPDEPPQWSWGIILLQLLMLAVIGVPVFGVFDAILDFYRNSLLSGGLLGSKSQNRFKP